MADENTPNREGLPITTGDAGGMQRTDDFTGQINPPEPEPRPPRPDDGHNRDGHHHHNHHHGADEIPYSDDIDDSVYCLSNSFDCTFDESIPPTLISLENYTINAGFNFDSCIYEISDTNYVTAPSYFCPVDEILNPHNSCLMINTQERCFWVSSF